MNSNDIALLAIHCITYNQESYIRECLEGFVMQKTNFKFVAIVHDDASTDKTADIIREYEAKYSDIIKPIYETENQYSKKDGSLDEIMNSVINSTGAKYIARCEGDDYWTDPYKLQKQVDFLENNKEYSLCFHKCKTLIQERNEFIPERVKDMPGESSIYDLAKGNYIHTPSVVYRRDDRVVEDRAKMPKNLAVGDYVQWMLIAQYGKIMKLPDEMAVYRQGSGTWSTMPVSYIAPRWIEVLHYLVIFFNSKNAVVSNKLMNQMKDSVEFAFKDYEMEMEKMDTKLDKLRKSKTYRMGKFVLIPLRFIVDFNNRIKLRGM